MLLRLTKCRKSNNCIVALALVAAAWTFVPPSSAGSPAGASVVNQVAELFSSWSSKASNKVLLDKAASLIDYDMMSEAALGDYWNKLNPVQRREFVTTFRILIEEKYYERWHKIFQKGDLQYRNESQSGGELFIKTTLTVGKKQDALVWRLKRKDGTYRVISLQVNEKDLVQQLSLRLERHTKKDNFEKLLTWMKEEADVVEDHSNS